MRLRFAALPGLLMALAIAGPATANSLDRFSFEEELVQEFSCGALLTTHVEADGTAHLAPDGRWIFTNIRFAYTGLVADPSTGRTFDLKGRQILGERPGEAVLRGQGTFIRLAGEGVVLNDVGRLLFDPGDGSTIAASAHVIRFDDPAGADRIDAAVCSLFD